MEKKKNNPLEGNDDVEKYFDENNYSTLVVRGESEFQEKKKHIEDFVELLTNGINEDKVAALKLLKEKNAQEPLLEAVLDVENKKVKYLLIAACWESGLDFGKYAEPFFDLAIDTDLMVSLEASTVLETIEVFESKKILEDGIAKITLAIKDKHPNMEMLTDLKLHLFEVLKELDGK